MLWASLLLRVATFQLSSPLPTFPWAIQPHWQPLVSCWPTWGPLSILSSPPHYSAPLGSSEPDPFLCSSALLPCSSLSVPPLSASTLASPSFPGLEPSGPLTVYAGAGSRVDLPCRLPPGVGTQSSLTAKWSPPGGGPDLLVAGDNGNFTLQLEAVSQAQAGAYTCHIHLQGQQLSATVTLAVITGQSQVGKELPSQESWDRKARPWLGQDGADPLPDARPVGTSRRGNPGGLLLSRPHIKN